MTDTPTTDALIAQPTEAIDQLTNHQQQADMHGERVTVSRQALDEVLAYIVQPRAGASGEREADGWDRGMRDAANICASLAETTYDDADAFETATGCEAAIVRKLRMHQRTRSEADEAPGVEIPDYQRGWAEGHRAAVERYEAGVEIPAGMVRWDGVQQIDRISAADLLDELSNMLDHDGLGQIANLIRDGEYDNHEVVAAFVRHRLGTPIAQPVASSREAVARDAPECATSCGDPRWCTEAKACWRTNEWRDGAVRPRVVAALTPDAAKSDAVKAGRKAVARCIEIARETEEGFLAPEYATDQPMSSFNERFACEQVAEAIENEFGIGSDEQRRLLGKPTMGEEYRAALATPTAPSDQA